MNKNIFLRIFMVITISLILISCGEDDPVTPEEDHLEAIGMVFYDSGIEIARILRGITSDTLKTTQGGMSGHIDVKFIDENEKVIDAPSEEHFKLAWEIADTSIAAIWQHPGEEGTFEVHVKGIKEGITEIEFKVMHEDHSDYRSGEIPVKIEPANANSHGEPVGFKLNDEESDSLLLTLKPDTTMGSFSLTAGTTTDHIEVTFFDDNNVEFSPAAPPHSLSITSSDESILKITGQESDEPWAFKFQGVAAGTADVTLKLMHDGSVDKEFRTFKVTVQ